MKAMTPVSGSISRLPGWGSPWKKPSKSTCLIRARVRFRAIGALSRPGAPTPSSLVGLTPLTNSSVITLSTAELEVDFRHLDAGHVPACCPRGAGA